MKVLNVGGPMICCPGEHNKRAGIQYNLKNILVYNLLCTYGEESSSTLCTLY